MDDTLTKLRFIADKLDRAHALTGKTVAADEDAYDEALRWRGSFEAIVNGTTHWTVEEYIWKAFVEYKFNHIIPDYDAEEAWYESLLDFLQGQLVSD